MSIRPVALIVLDGFGLAPEGPGNAVRLASTPAFDRIWEGSPRTELQASGRAVGLPEGQMGNSEVGHMNIGAGRVVRQSLTHIQELIDSGAFFEDPVLTRAFEAADEDGTVHLMGLASRGGVHSDLTHLFALLELAARLGRRVVVHAFTDGRDTAPDSGRGFVGEIEAEIARLAAERGLDARVGTVTGRYFAMDRDRRWERTRKAYDAVVLGRAGHRAGSGVEAVEAAYGRGETDEFVEPTVVGDYRGIQDGDSVVFSNFRADRARQLTYALLGDDGSGSFGGFERERAPKIAYASLMRYDAALDAPFAFALPELTDGLSETVARAGLSQYHTAETEKYPHVTYFFNAKREEPFEGEERAMVPSPKVATYDLQPEMSAPELAERTARRIAEGDDALVLINFANPDMVGHTGDLQAAIRACEASDRGLARVLEALEAKGGAAVVIADHGNAETMFAEDGGPHTAHTTNPVPCVVVGAGDLRLRSGGVLGDVAPTVLELLGIEAPEAMTGRSLIER